VGILLSEKLWLLQNQSECWWQILGWNEIWFVSCKRNPEKQLSVMPELFANATYFMENHKQFQELNRVYVCISPYFNLEQRTKIHDMGGKAISISELVQEL
jgi:hypothetical protein